MEKSVPRSRKINDSCNGLCCNGPGESRHADIGISLPGALEEPIAPVYIKGKKVTILKGKDIKRKFIAILHKHIKGEI